MAILFSWGGFLVTPAHGDRPTGISPQTIRSQSGPASLKGLGESFSPNIATGTGSISVPIWVAPGPLKPTLGLVYNGGNGKSALGMGFELPLLNVYRMTDKGLPHFNEEDRFAVSGAGINDELVPVDRGSGYYRLKNESAFVLFIRDASAGTWTLKFPDGDTAVLGASTQSRQASSGRPYRWFVERYRDQFGREIYYEYTTDQGYLYVDAIKYQTHRDDAYANQVLFHYEERPYPFTDYTYGTKVTCGKRLRRIEVFHQERRLREYHLAYKEDEVFSLLHQVKMVGEFGEEMPTLTFDYIQHSSQSGEFVKMVHLPPLEGVMQGYAELEDVNGDGLPDLLVGVKNAYKYYENLDGRRWSETAVPLANSPDVSLGPGGAQLADINGDGFRDVVFKREGVFVYYPAGDITAGVFNGYGEAAQLAHSSGAGLDFASADVKICDLNGDGRVDMLWQKPGQDSAVINGKDDVLLEQYIPELPVDVDFGNPQVQLHDFNGDGLLDFVLKKIDQETGRIRVWYGEGGGRYRSEQEMLGVPRGGRSDEYHLQDVNKDGQTDIVRISGTWLTYYLNRGDGGFSGPGGSFYAMPPMSETRRLLFADMNGNGTTDAVWLTMDGQLKYLDIMGAPYMGMMSRVDNGMGLVTEISYRVSTDYAIEAKERQAPWKTPMPHPVPVISEIYTTDSLDLLGIDATESVTTFDYRDGYWDGNEREHRGFAAVTSISHGDGFHDSQITETHMHVGRDLVTQDDEETLKGRPWLQLVKDSSGNLLKSVETKWEQRWLCQEELTGVSKQILPTCSDYPDRQAHKDELVAIGVSTETLSGVFEGTAHPRWVGAKEWHDAWGSVARGETYGEVVFAQSRIPGEPFALSEANVRAGDDEIITEADYIYDTESWYIGLPAETRTYDIDGALLASSRIYYDGDAFVGLPLGQVSLGLPTRKSVWHSASNRWIDTQRAQFNSDGQRVATMDVNDNIVRVEYDEATRSLPVKEQVEVASGTLTIEAAYDTGFQTIASMNDFNGNSTRFQYDGLGRPIAVWDPLTTGAPSTEYIYRFGDSENPISSVTTRLLVDRASGLYRETYQYSDGAGRTRLVKAEAEDAYGYLAAGWSRLTARGSVSHVYDSFPSPSPGFEPGPAGLAATVSRFDALGRAVSVTPPATEAYGETHSLTEYLPFETRVYDERDSFEKNWMYPAITRVDGLGRVRESLKYNDVDGQFTEFGWSIAYDALGNISEFTDPQNHTRYYTHDNLGRLVHVDDVNIGTIDYTYDDAGNLLTRVDALGQVQSFEYGAANRVTAVHMSADAHGRPDYSYEYRYDLPSPLLPDGQNLLGRLTQVAWPTGTYQASFDALGRVAQEALTLWDGVSAREDQTRDRFEQTYRYNAAGELIGQTAPGGFELAFDANQRSLVAQVRAGFDGALSELFGGMVYDHRGALKQSDARNGVRSCSWYDHRARLVGTMTGPVADISCDADPRTPQGAVFAQLTYAYTPTGLIKAIDDVSPATPGVPRFSATYEYDRLCQLVRAQTADGVLGYRYDTIQNLRGRTLTDPTTGEDVAFKELPVGLFDYGEDGAGPNQITSAGDQRFEYDVVGQMTAYNGFDLQFDVEGRLVTAHKGDHATIEHFYDDLGDKSLTIVTRPGKAPRVYRYVFDGYQIRDGQQTWFVTGGHGEAEITLRDGLTVDLALLEELTAYVADPLNAKKPLPAEYMDLDGDGDDDFDSGDLAVAEAAYWNETTVGGPANVIRYYHADHLGGSTVVTDSAGDVISTMRYHPYGETASRSGQEPVTGFAGGEIEEESELGLTRFGARWYAPAIGRWASGDFYIGESPSLMARKPLESSLYSYAANNPVMNVDPTGNETIVDMARRKVAEKTYQEAKAQYKEVKEELANALTQAEAQMEKFQASLPAYSGMPPDFGAAARIEFEYWALAGKISEIRAAQQTINDSWNEIEETFVAIYAADNGRDVFSNGDGKARSWDFSPKSVEDKTREKLNAFERRALLYTETVGAIKTSGVLSVAIVGGYLAYDGQLSQQEQRDIAVIASSLNQAFESGAQGAGKETGLVNSPIKKPERYKVQPTNRQKRAIGRRRQQEASKHKNRPR